MFLSTFKEKRPHAGGAFGAPSVQGLKPSITKIERLENAYVQEKFMTELRLASQKYKGKSPSQLVKLLFHGSKGTDSDLIVKSE